MEVSVIMGDAFRFTTYDKDQNMFKVHSNLVLPEDVGEYPIQVEARFFNATFSETYRKTFILTIWDDPPPEEEAWFPPSPIFYPEWKPTNYIRKNTTQEEDPNRPIPYIADLSSDGVLKIGWNKEMKPPKNITEIPPTKIAVEEGMSLEEYRFYEERRGLQPSDTFSL